MNSKFIKLVLKKSILNKKEGNITSLIVGLLFLIIVIILIMFNFRVTILSEVFYNIDDALTASTLGASVPNPNAYNYSNKYPEKGNLIFQDALTDSTYVNYTQGDLGWSNEQRIVMSELNSDLINNGRHDAAKLSNPNNIKYMEDAAELKRIGYTNLVNNDEYSSYTLYKEENRSKIDDEYSIKVINNLLGSTYTNLTQNTVDAPVFNSSSDLDNVFCINKDSVVDKTFLGSYLSSDMDITRIELYNIYRYTLAKRHVYASPYMIYKVNGVDGYTWDGYSLYGVKSSKTKLLLSNGKQSNAVRDMINTTLESVGADNAIDIEVSGWQGPEDEEEFKDLMQELYPAMVIRGRVPEYMESVDEEDYTMYDMMKALWSLDLAAWRAREQYPLIFWEDTGVTCTTDWLSSENELRDYYGYLWCNNSKNVVKIRHSVLVEDESGNSVLPIEGYSVYAYVRGQGLTVRYNNLSTLNDYNNFKATKIVKLGDFNADNVTDDKCATGTVYTDRKVNADLYSSSIYMEVAFDVRTFPNNSTDPNTKDSFLNLAEFSTKPVTQARLVSVTKKE